MLVYFTLVTHREEEFIKGLFHLEGESFLRLKHKTESDKLSLTHNRRKWIKDHKIDLSKILTVVSELNGAVRTSLISERERKEGRRDCS